MAVVLIFGWWLVAASGAQQLPRPSVSLHPSYGVAVGGNVTVRCHVPRMAAWVWLYQDRGRTHNKYKEEERDAAEFSFIRTSRELRGIYRCQFHVSEPLGTSETSDPVELVLTDRRYPPPGISVSPEERVRVGTNVTIRCWNRDGGVTILLHKDGLPVQHQDGGTANFTLSGVIPSDAGTYRCSYRPKDDPFVSSPLGDSVTLEVTPTPPGAHGGSRVGLLMAAAGGCTAAFGLILIISFLLATCRRQIQRAVTPGEPRKISKVRVPPADAEPLTYIELNIATPSMLPPNPPAAPQPHVIYAEVTAGGQH